MINYKTVETLISNHRCIFHLQCYKTRVMHVIQTSTIKSGYGKKLLIPFCPF